MVAVACHSDPNFRRPGRFESTAVFLPAADAAAAVERFRRAGYAIVQEPRAYDWGSEAFVRDPDGYIIALIKMTPIKR